MTWPFGRSRAAVRTLTASRAVSGIVPTDSVVSPVDPAAVVQTLWRKGGTLSMQGYPPTVTVSRNRHGTRCDCGEVVLQGVRHVCMYNAEHYLGRMTREEYHRVIAQLRNRLVKRGMV